ncbi:EthD domain-containing protein [Rhodococcus opacus]|uniref:EthD domain-containing protein n=1 Tax=Rhodococcus opacus TaxID=37919 RepID=UPI0006BB4887|nr:EthD domain-containing protein [Rhodococcus opacus]MDJ0415371.1 EthD domain-containing protein [Rhodococcus opacus]MDV7090940.1 EthD domain-containing protein [Rhodococcus opacus]UNN04694.1 EthD domain-containing protein [Rhodococcus opacus]WKN52491.1 EthD domain-containing protein [Rhodococcus opacus]
MSYKMVAFLAKREGLSMEEFVDYYERRHVPLVLSLPEKPNSYVRNYIETSDNDMGFDVVSELRFEDEDAFKRWIAAMFAPNSGIPEDEDQFLDRRHTRSHVVREYPTRCVE